MRPTLATEGRRRWLPALAVPALILGFLCASPSQGDARAGAQTAERCPPSPSPHTPAPPVILPTHPPAPGQILVCVGSRAITGAVFEHWATVAMKSEGPNPKQPAAQGEVIGEVMGFLISSDWVLGEASALHVRVSSATVKRRFDHIRKQQFHTRKEFNAFLKSSGQTVADLMLRVKLNLLSTRIQKHVLAGHRGEAGKKHALERFVKGFKHRWSGRTYCSPEYSSADCGHIHALPL
jgi:hypothetical protein